MSNIVVLGTPAIGNTITFALSDRTAQNQLYALALSTDINPPLVLPDGRVFGLTPNSVFTASLFWPSLLGLRDSYGLFNSGGNALASWTVPNVPELVGLTVYAGFVSLDTLQPGTRSIISISPVAAMRIVSR